MTKRNVMKGTYIDFLILSTGCLAGPVECLFELTRCFFIGLFNLGISGIRWCWSLEGKINYMKAGVVIDAILVSSFIFFYLKLHKATEKNADTAQKTLAIAYRSVIDFKYVSTPEVKPAEDDQGTYIVTLEFEISSNVPTKLMSAECSTLQNIPSKNGTFEYRVENEEVSPTRAAKVWVMLSVETGKDILILINTEIHYEDAGSGKVESTKFQHTYESLANGGSEVERSVLPKDYTYKGV